MWVDVGAFSAAAVLIVLLPGPDTLVVLRGLVRSGRPGAARTAAGVLCGLSVWVLVAALGLSAVLRASTTAYTVLRVAGAAYLLALGVRSLRSRGEATDAAPRRLPLRSGFGAGLLTDLLNPKVGVFFVTFLPGFVPAGRSVAVMSVLLGTIFVLLTAAYFAVLLVAAAPVTRWLSTRRVRRRVDRATGVVLVGFGARLLAEG